MKKYLEYFDGAFDSTVADKIKPENKPYVAYSRTEGVVYTVIPKEQTSAYQMIDLGLPSGLKWADKNVGADTPQDYGLYFSWGNVDGHAVDESGIVADGYSFDKNTYSTSIGGQYTGSTLDAEHDAATVNMSSDWRMPTSTETYELLNNTDHYFIGGNGSIVDKSNLDGSELRSICFVKKGEDFDYSVRGNFIEFPFAGFCKDSLIDKKNLYGYVWSSTIISGPQGLSRGFYFNSDGRLDNQGTFTRYTGRSVRGVHA